MKYSAASLIVEYKCNIYFAFPNEKCFVFIIIELILWANQRLSSMDISEVYISLLLGFYVLNKGINKRVNIRSFKSNPVQISCKASNSFLFRLVLVKS